MRPRLLCLAVAISMAVASLVSRPAFAGFEVPVCTNSPANQWMPAASGTRVVWADLRDGNWDIYLYDLATGEEAAVCTAPDDQMWPEIDGDHIVWMDHRSGEWAVYLHDLSTGAEQKLSDAPITGSYTVWDTQGPDISGNYVVWSDTRNGPFDVFLYDLSLGTVKQVTSDAGDNGQQGPRVQGQSIVYRSTRNDPGGDIYLYDIATSLESVVADGPADQAQPDIWGGLVVWREAGEGGFDIHYRDLSGGSAQPLVATSATEDHPRVNSRYIVWPSTEMNGDNTVAWQKVSALDLRTMTEVPVTVSSQYFGTLGPGLSDSGVIVFEDFRNGTRNPEQTNADIYGYILTRFRDVLLTNWAYDAVDACTAAGVVAGYGDGTYHPERMVTRDQMAAYISRALAGGDGNVQVPTGVAEPTFTDVPADHWAYRYVEYCVDQGIVQGYWNGYRPDETVNRGQMAVYVARSVADPLGDPGVPEVAVGTIPAFSDVTADNDWGWCYKYVQYIATLDPAVVQGYADGTYHPERPVTRDQMAVYVARAFQLPM